MDATTLNNLAAQIEIPADGTISTTIYQDDHLKAVLFGFAAGQELSEHTASMAAILHFVQGEAHVTLGAQELTAQANTWIHLPRPASTSATPALPRASAPSAAAPSPPSASAPAMRSPRSQATTPIMPHPTWNAALSQCCRPRPSRTRRMAR